MSHHFAHLSILVSFAYIAFLRSFAQAVGCDITSLKACAKKKSVQEILAAQLKVFSEPNFLPLAPVVGEVFLPGMSAKYIILACQIRNSVLRMYFVVVVGLALQRVFFFTCALKPDAQVVFCKGFMIFFFGISHSPRTPLCHAHR